MAQAGAIRAGQAFVEVFADDSRLAKGLYAASRRLKKWGESLRTWGAKIFAAGMAGVGTFVAAGKAFSEAGDQLQDMSARLGLGVEFLSALDYAAAMGGADLATMEDAIAKLQSTAWKASRGAAAAQLAFQTLGVEVADAAGNLRPTEQLFTDAISALASLENHTLKAALATAIFGGAGRALLPMLQDGVDGIEAAMDEARQLGLVMSSRDAKAAAELDDSLTRLSRSFKGIVTTVGAAVAPVLTELADRLARATKPLRDWIGQHRGFVVFALGTATAVAALGAALVGLGAAFGVAAKAVAVVRAGVLAFGVVLKTAMAVVAALVSPIGLLAVGLSLLAGVALWASGAAGAAFQWLRRQFAELADTGQKAWQAIASALAAGDLSLAARVAWLTLKYEWQRGIAGLAEYWAEFKESFLATATEAVYGLAKVLTVAWASLRVSWAEMLAGLQAGWSRFTRAVVTGWRTAQHWIAQKFVQLMALVDKSVDAEGAMRILDEEFAQEQEARDRAAQQELADIERSVDARRQAIEQEQAAALKALEEERQRRHVERRKSYEEELAASQRGVAEAKAQMEAAFREAAQKVKEVPAPEPGPKRFGPGLLKPLGMAAKGTSVTGTFFAGRAWGLGAGALERTAFNTERIAKNTDVMVRLWEEENRFEP